MKCETCGQPLPAPEIDWQELALNLRMEMARRNLSYRQTGDLIGVDQATLHRVAKHAKPVMAGPYNAMLNFINGEHKERESSALTARSET